MPYVHRIITGALNDEQNIILTTHAKKRKKVLKKRNITRIGCWNITHICGIFGGKEKGKPDLQLYPDLQCKT